MGAGELRGEGSLCAIAAAGTDIDDLGAMHEAVYDGVGNGCISQGLSPFLEADAGGNDDGEFILTCADQVEEEGGILGFHPEVVYMVDD